MKNNKHNSINPIVPLKFPKINQKNKKSTLDPKSSQALIYFFGQFECHLNWPLTIVNLIQGYLNYISK
jgi:hypothetical protein